MTSHSKKRAQHKDHVNANFPALQYRFVQIFTEHLADCSRWFDGDLQQMLILALIGQVQLDHYLKNKGDLSDVRGLSASRLADVTGIPRQTVRRKLALLAKRGWIEETAPGSWRMTIQDGKTKAGVDLAELNERNKDRIARILMGLSPITDD